MKPPRHALATLPAALLVAACAGPPAQRGAAATDAWLGRWHGPEGTYLRLAGGGGRYDVTVRDLDGARRFRGIATGNVIRFERDGVQETIRASDGEATGMKWLRGKSDCLSVRPGEGYCRD